MARISFTTYLVAFTLVLCIANAKLLRTPNPCAIPASEKKCRKSKVCAAFGFILRFAKCVPEPKFKPGCICPLILKPVCCRLFSGKGVITKTASNSCICKCQHGKVLFNRKCTAPPFKGSCIEIFDPVCCYIRKFDLTYTATNSCFCKAAGGFKTKNQRLCKH